MDLPTWFLVASLFLPRVSLVGAYVTDLAPIASISGFLPVAMAAVFPRIVVILLIFMTLVGVGGSCRIAWRLRWSTRRPEARHADVGL